MSKKIRYFDYNATHPPFAEILLSLQKDYFEDFYNPSGATRFSLARQGKIESARKVLEEYTGKPAKEFVFSSTGTEANHLLAYGIRRRFGESAIVSSLEHPSLYSALEFSGFSYRKIRSLRAGTIDTDHLRILLNEMPAPVFVLHVANESGVVQPLEEIASLCREFEVPLFSDLMQSFGKLEIPYAILDGFTFSGHKIGAGMGSSGTWIRADLTNDKEFSIFRGGNQENNHRAGTENSPSILAIAEVLRFRQTQQSEKNETLRTYQNRIESVLENSGCEIVGRHATRVPNTSFCILPTDDVDFFMMGMEEAGFVVSTGSSCKSRSREPAASLLSMGYSQEEALRAIRISTGWFTTEEEVEELCEKISEVIRALSD
ncbi:aminotransferase class V-fold PLP-dependent enzyme [Leptospira gomenensis]|uniref:Aminotransferase class V-fold PLP-dependent enzyme n=1 Tax=Leptospira gomenensis TaxID=2484974 RepID=A0A5F1YSB7_9LEPT|nr:aminotransferase class V-fold PLP-dependent enzyme [Leptospira gomenensis]TGK38657.1 aminotransferase class V-fold PLP-dependent enzyme [Leptospira gomenensis]TGK42894.1 aminotransferase class V-fold PLP-dependent enzyme [Leptospira gomenensis]TGK49561.1 aminotransferase class V-fold PLP-dependent enzyme [Leptospira gomenensis]TGK60769.1 aminotransferase class V-fold PLP-dependent enzyme [Leptospira gomenensis]